MSPTLRRGQRATAMPQGRRWPYPQPRLRFQRSRLSYRWALGLVHERDHCTDASIYALGLGSRSLGLYVPTVWWRATKRNARAVAAGEPSMAYVTRLSRLARSLVEEGRYEPERPTLANLLSKATRPADRLTEEERQRVEARIGQHIQGLLGEPQRRAMLAAHDLMHGRPAGTPPWMPPPITRVEGISG